MCGQKGLNVKKPWLTANVKSDALKGKKCALKAWSEIEWSLNIKWFRILTEFIAIQKLRGFEEQLAIKLRQKT